jgi:hypothetical protein
MKRLAIDPGDVHVGWAYDDDHTVTAGEWTPAETPDRIVAMLTRNQVDEIIIEEWVLYDWETEKQAWSDFKSSQLIGALKLVASWFRIPVVMQGANVKKPTRRQLAARGIKQVGPVIHARDAELHLYYRKLRRAKERDDRMEASG